MKKYLLTVIAAIATHASVWAQYPEGYLSDEERPEPYRWIPDPPIMTSGAFMDDFYYYQWGLQQRTVEGVSEMAIFDEQAELWDVFNITIGGYSLSIEHTPEIMKLAERAVTDVHAANKTVKNKYQRIRPFATFKDSSLVPESDEEEAATFSYPSGHSSRGYIFAMALCTVMPEYTNDLIARAEQYAINRVICGHHWKSDTNASLLLAAGLFTNIVATEAFQEQLKKAREEYKRLTSSDISVVISETPARKGFIYDINGRRLDTKPDNGVYIQDGQKFMGK